MARHYNYEHTKCKNAYSSILLDEFETNKVVSLAKNELKRFHTTK